MKESEFNETAKSAEILQNSAEEILVEPQNDAKSENSTEELSNEVCSAEEMTSEASEEMITVSEAQRREEAAYLRGRNEAITAKMTGDMKQLDSESAIIFEEEDLPFHFRKSVWDDCQI
jgi:hypothetical protein